MALTREEVLNYRYSRPELKTESEPVEKPKGSAFDLIASFGSGAGSLVSGVGTFFAGSDSTLAELGYNAQDYWNERKSDRLKAEEADLSKRISEGDWSGAGSKVLTSPFLAANMLAGSAPAMAAGMGVGGLVARGMAGAGAMTNAAGQLTRAGGAVASGIGEGAFIATDVYEATKGNIAAAGAAGVLLGVGVSAITPSAVGAGFARKVAGTADNGLTATSQAITGGMGALERAGAGYATLRAGRTAGQEFAQEFVQEGGQAITEQLGRGEELNLKSAAAQAVVGGILGAQTGLALHPLTGEGSKAAELQDALRAKASIEQLGQSADPATEQQRLQALRIADARVGVLTAELTVIEKRGEATEGEKLAVDAAYAREEAARNPADDLARTKAAKLTIDSQLADIPPEQRTPTQVQAAKVAEADYLAAKNPDNRELKDQADTAKAAMLLNESSPEVVREGTDKAMRIGQTAIIQAPTLDVALQDFSRTEDASAVGRTAVGGLTNTMNGLEQALSETYDEHSEAQKAEEKAIAEAAKQARKQAQKDAVAAAQQETKVAKLNQERAKLGLPTIDANMIPAAETELESLDNAPPVSSARDAYIAEYDERRADIIAAMPTEALQAQQTNNGVSQIARDYAAEVLAQRAQAARTPRTSMTVAEAERRLRTMLQADGDSQQRIDETVANLRREAATGDVAGIEAVARGFESRNDHRPAEFLRALLDEREAGGTTAAQTDDQRRLEGARQAARDAGATQATITYYENLSDGNLKERVHLLDSSRAMRDFAHHILAERGVDPGITYGQFVARENELEAALADLVRAEPSRSAYQYTNRLASMSESSLNLMANGQNSSGRANAEQARAARVAIAFNNKTHLGNVDQFITPVQAAQAQAAPAVQPPSGLTRAEIESEYESALEDWADNMGSTVSTARRHVEGLSDERVLEGLNDPDLAPFMLPVAQYRNLPIPDNVLNPPAPVTREVENNFEQRAMKALRNGVLDKLGKFWTEVMRGRGQRVFNIDTSDLAFQYSDYYDIEQSALDELKDRYNDELNRQAQRWARENNQPLNTLVNPVVSITANDSYIIIRVRSLGRNGQNPYAVPQNDSNIGVASMDKDDGHLTTTGLAPAKGSSNLAYRLAAEIGRMAGQNVPAATSLLTNNRMRRHMQSIYADYLFGAGHVSPMQSDGDESYQGIPTQVWEAMNSDNQRAGLNILRAAHQATENRYGNLTPISRFIENLSYNAQGQIVATSDPKHSRGWAKGTVVTDDMLTQKLLEVDRDFDFDASWDRTQFRPGDPRNSGETAAGRSGSGGVGPDTAKLVIMTNTILNRIENDPDATIPAAWVTRAKKIGREIGGWMFSEAEKAGAKGIDADEATSRVVKMIGENAARVLLDSGMIDFVQTGAELTGETFSDSNGKVQGATTPDGKIILVLDNLSDKTFDAVLSHEAIHATLKTLLGEDTYNTLMSRLDTMLKAGEGSQWVKDANARVPAGTSEQDRLEEIAGYAVELHVRGGTRGNPLVQWAKDFMSALRTAIIQNKALPEKLRTWAMQNIQPADLSRMAIAGLKRAAAQNEADLKPNPKAPSINVGLVVGMGETAETLTPEFVRAEIEKLGVKVGRNNVVDASYEHNGETINETTLVAELSRPLTPAEIERLAINTKQQAIPQRVDGVGTLHGPMAAEWGGFSAHEFRELNGRRSDEVARQSRARDWDAEIKALMEEHRNPKTTNARRSQINDELRSARMFQRADQEVRYAARTGQKFSVGASYGTPREGAVSVVGVHFSGAQRDMLSTAAYGTGIKGAEAERLSLPENRDIRDRTMFYVDEGKGVIPEQGVGAVGHQVRLNNLYDLRADALGLRNPDLSKMERDIVASGFDGYYAPNYRDMGQGVAVVIGKHSIPTEPYVPGEGAAPAPTFTGNEYGEALAKSKLPGGAMLGREWLVAIANTEFDTPPVRAQLEQRPDERIYRDDLPRFNRGLRYSMSEEHQAIDPPVAEELPNTLNILDLARRGPIERALEKMRSNIQDKHTTLRRIQQLAGVVREQVKLDTIGALERLGSKLMVQQERLVDAPLAKIESILNKAGFSAEEARKSLDDLLVARHAAEYNEHTATINPAKYDADGKYLGGHDAKHPGSGVTDGQARDTIRLLTGVPGAKTTALLEAEQVYRQMISDLQQFAVERGLEKQQTIDNWNEKFPFYTPFNRELNLEENISVGSMPGTAGFSLRSGIARRAMGSGADIISPLASTALWGLKTTQRGENAIVARTFLEFAKFVTPNYLSADGKLKPMWSVEKIPNTRVLKKVNVYLVPKADGGMSPEFYNREQAQAYADMQQAMWEEANPKAEPNESGIEVQRPYDEPQSRVLIQPMPNYLNQPNVMVIPVEGENVIITFDPKSKDAMAIIDAFKNKAGSGEGVQKLNKLLAIPRMFSRWVMATSTGYNPVFAVFNAARDIQAAAINAGADKIPGWTAGDSGAIAGKWVPAVREINKRLAEEFKQMHSNDYTAPPVAPDSLGEWMDRMKAAGGATGITHSIVDVESAETQLRRLFGQAVLNQVKPVGAPNDFLSKMDEAVAKVGDAFYNFGQGESKGKIMGAISRQLPARVARWNEAAELTTRTLVFKRATELYLQAGHDVETAEKLAANISKNISTNFNRRGNWTNVINQLFPFFNAAANGTARLAETIWEKGTRETNVNGQVMLDQKTKLTPYGKKVMGVIGSIGFLQAALLLMAGFEDDDIPEEIKDRNFIIPTFGALSSYGDKDYIKIPMPHGFNLLVNTGRNFADASYHLATGEPGKAAKNLYGATIGQLPALNPVGSAGNIITDLSPAIADPFVSLAMNKDAFGRPIAKEDLNPANPTPGFTRAREGASSTGRILAEGLNTLSGGNEDQKGLISPTPDQIDFVLGSIGGGVGREAMKAGSALKAGYDMAVGNEREVMPSQKLPLIGRLYGDAGEPSVLRSKLFAVSTEVNETYARYKGLKERGLKEEAAAFKAKHPEISLRDDIERYARGNAKQTKARALAREEGEIAEVNRISNKQDAAIATLLDKYQKLK